MTHSSIDRRSIVLGALAAFGIPGLTAFTPPTLCSTPALLAGGSTKTCPCKRSGAASIPANDPTWRPLFGMKGKSPSFSASGLAYFCAGDEEYWTTVALKTAATLASAAIGYACPQCGVFAQAVDLGSALLLKEPGASKFSAPFGNDPTLSSGYGSKKCGGLVLSLGSPKSKAGSCACSASNVYHLVKDPKARWGPYEKQHKSLTVSELQAKVKAVKSGTLYAQAWDQPGGHYDNRGAFRLAWLN